MKDILHRGRVGRNSVVLLAGLAITCILWVHHTSLEHIVLELERSREHTVLTSRMFEKLRRSEGLLYSKELNVFETGCLSSIDLDGLIHLNKMENFASEPQPHRGATNQTAKSEGFEETFSRPGDPDKTPNVVIFVVDSLSRSEVNKYLPITTQYLHSLVPSRVEALEYLTLAFPQFITMNPDSTPGHIVPLLSGTKWGEKVKSWIFDELDDAGYKLSYFQFSQRLITKAFWTTADKKWAAPVTDLFNRTINRRQFTTFRRNPRFWNRVTADPEFHDVMPAREAGVLLRGLSRWWQNSAAFPKLSFVHLLAGHFPSPASQIQLHDIAIKRAIQALLESRNTVVILMTDHGHQTSDIGYFLPYLKVLVPLELLKVHPKLAKIVDVGIENGDKMFGTIDLHHFLRGITLFQKTEVEVAGLLSNLNSSRSCEDAGAVPGHCLCDQSMMKEVNIPTEVTSVLKKTLEMYRTEGCTRLVVTNSTAVALEQPHMIKWIVKLHTTNERLFEGHVVKQQKDTFEVVALKQLTSYKKYEHCASKVYSNPEFCVC